MTKQTMESLEASGFDGMIQEGPDAFDGHDGTLPCFVHHPYAGGWCERPAVMQVYGINFCEVHGAEVKAGVMAEIYHDAARDIENMSRYEDSSANVAMDTYLSIGHRELTNRCIEAEEAQVVALQRAYPVIEKHVGPETSEHDYYDTHGNPDPGDTYMDARMHTHKLMRLSWSVGEYWILEILENEREHASAQLAFALEDRARKTGQPA